MIMKWQLNANWNFNAIWILFYTLNSFIKNLKWAIVIAEYKSRPLQMNACKYWMITVLQYIFISETPAIISFIILLWGNSNINKT